MNVFHTLEFSQILSGSCQSSGIEVDHHAAGTLRPVDVGMGFARRLEQDALRPASKRAASTMLNKVATEYDHKVGQPVSMTGKPSAGGMAGFGELETAGL